MELITRNDFDKQIVHSVTELDEYRLRSWRDAGSRVRIALDIGAHIGAFTRFTKELWPDAEVIAVEPAHDADPIFEQNTAGLSGIQFHSLAIVAEGSGNFTNLVRAADGNEAAAYTRDYPPLWQQFQEVPATSLPELLARHGNPTIDLLKLDCEGAESVAIADLQRVGYLPRVIRIVGEWHGFHSVHPLLAALRQTHDIELYCHPHNHGAFFATLCRPNLEHLVP